LTVLFLTLFGSLFTAAVCWALGLLLFRRLSIVLRPVEHDLLAALTGAAMLSCAVFLLCTLKLARTPVFLGFGIGLIALASPMWGRRSRLPGRRGWRGVRGDSSADAPLRSEQKLGPKVGQAVPPVLNAKRSVLICLIPFAFYGIVYLANSLAPEFSPDGSAYHLGLVARYFRQHGFERLTTNMYANLTQGTEMLFLFAFAFGRHSAAATVHCFFLLTLPVLMLCYARRTGHPAAGVCAAMLVFLSPLAGIDGVSAYNDVALATTAFATFYLLEIWREENLEENGDRLLIPTGLLAGFCFAIKYTGFVATLYAVFVLRKRAAKMLPAAACMALPWLVKNALWLGNPLSPFFNRLFPNPYIHVSFEEFYRSYLSAYGLPTLKPLFWIVTVTGQLGGQIGPLFLLAPLALLSLRSRAGRHCLLAALFFLLPYPQNIGARFLIPVLPFLAFGIALALEFSQAAQITLVAAAAILAWPRIIDRYRAPAGGWQITTVPWQAALHIVPPETWLRRRYAGYRLAETINRHVPPTQKLWSTIPLAEAYIQPDVLVFYYSAESEEIQDILLTPVTESMKPLWTLRFTFAPRKLSHLQIVQSATSPDDIWSVGEARFFHQQNEVSPVAATAHPFPWDVGLALDRNPVTRWRSWESIHAGMTLDFDFGMPTELDRVELYCSHDQDGIAVHLDGIDARLEKVDGPPAGDLRRLATRTVKSRGISYLMIGKDYPAAADMQADPARWGLRLAAQEEAGRLYEIQ
jgi:hypothetical protein